MHRHTTFVLLLAIMKSLFLFVILGTRKVNVKSVMCFKGEHFLNIMQLHYERVHIQLETQCEFLKICQS